MSDILGSNATKAQSEPPVMIKQSEQGARMRVTYDEYEFDGVASVNASETLAIGAKIPTGSRIHSISCDVSQLATAPNLISVDPAGVLTNRSLALASGVSSGDFDEFSSEDQMKLEFQAGEVPAAGTLKIAICYSTSNS